jgi:hypothetical protein
MTVGVTYFLVVFGLGFIFVIIGFIISPSRLKKFVPVTTVPSGNMGDGCAPIDLQDLQVKGQCFYDELKTKPMDQKPNQGEDYKQEKERRDVLAFSEYCNAGLLENLNA